MKQQREIKFRAWELKNKRWWTDWATLFPWGTKPDDASKVILGIISNHFEFNQYTGLKDKNGKEIYEGDILKDDVGEIFEVKFGTLPLDKSGDCVCSFEAFYAKGYGKLGQAAHYECNRIGEWMEIIGNIYEDPELLESK